MAWDGRFELVLGADGEVQLYDLDTDPREDINVAEENPVIVARLKKAIKKEWESMEN